MVFAPFSDHHQQHLSTRTFPAVWTPLSHFFFLLLILTYTTIYVFVGVQRSMTISRQAGRWGGNGRRRRIFHPLRNRVFIFIIRHDSVGGWWPRMHATWLLIYCLIFICLCWCLVWFYMRSILNKLIVFWPCLYLYACMQKSFK